jgi:hypothetical protein
MQDEAQARKYELERTEATQNSRIAADISNNNLASQTAQAAIKLIGTKTEAEKAKIIAETVQLGTAGMQGIQNMLGGGTFGDPASDVAKKRANELTRQAEMVQAVRDAGNAASIAASGASVEQSRLAVAEAEKALANLPLTSVAERATQIATIAARGFAGEANLEALYKNGKILKHEFDAGTTLARQAQSRIDRETIGEDRATAVGADGRYLEGASKYLSQKARAKHISDLREADEKAFEETARLLGFANANIYEQDLLARANAAAINTNLGRNQATATTAQTQAQTASILADDDLARRKFEQEKNIQNAANQRAQETHAAAKVAAQLSRKVENLRNSPLNLSIQNVRGGLTQLERARDTITDRQTAISNRIVELTKLANSPPPKPLTTLQADWDKRLAARAADIQGEIDRLREQEKDNLALLTDTESEITQSRTLLADMNKRQAAGATTYNPAAAPLPPTQPSGTYIRNGATVRGSPQQETDWASFRPDVAADSVIKSTMGSGQFSVPELLSTYRSEGKPPASSSVYATISARLTNMFTATGAVNNLENKIAFLDWLEKTYNISIPSDLDEVWVKT